MTERDHTAAWRALFPGAFNRDELGHVPPESEVWRALRPGPAFTLDHVKPSPVRQCIACGAKVPAGKSEACPHE